MCIYMYTISCLPHLLVLRPCSTVSQPSALAGLVINLALHMQSVHKPLHWYTTYTAPC